MLFQRRRRARSHVAGDADFERDLALTQILHQPQIFDSADAMADALGANFQGVPDAFRTARFTGMASEPQSALAGLQIEIAEPLPRALLFESAQADGHYALALPRGGEFENGPRGIHTPLTRRIENPADSQGRASSFAGQRVEHRGQVLLLPENDSGG